VDIALEILLVVVLDIPVEVDNDQVDQDNPALVVDQDNLALVADQDNLALVADQDNLALVVVQDNLALVVVQDNPALVVGHKLAEDSLVGVVQHTLAVVGHIVVA
jgi:hypothetical protein